MTLPTLNPWIWLVVAGAFEVVWVVFLKLSHGFERWPYNLITLITMGIGFFCMSQSLKVMPMGTVYAVWTGIGAAGGLAWGIAMDGEPIGLIRILCVMLILAGVAGLKLGA